MQLTVYKCSINFADDWIRTADLLYRKQPLYQLSHTTTALLSSWLLVHWVLKTIIKYGKGRIKTKTTLRVNKKFWIEKDSLWISHQNLPFRDQKWRPVALEVSTTLRSKFTCWSRRTCRCRWRRFAWRPHRSWWRRWARPSYRSQLSFNVVFVKQPLTSSPIWSTTSLRPTVAPEKISSVTSGINIKKSFFMNLPCT